MSHPAVNQQRDAAECLEMILNKISPQASEVSTRRDQVSYKVIRSKLKVNVTVVL